MRGKYCALCVYFVLNIYNCYSQTKTIENLKKQIQFAQNADQKLDALFLLCEQRLSLNSDTLCKYAWASKKLSLSQNSFTKKALADYYVANCYVKMGMLDSALLLCNRNIEKLQSDKAGREALLKLIALKAQVLVKSNKYKEGLTAFYRVLSIAEHSNDTLMQMIGRNGIGWVNMEMNQNAEALKWLYRALHTSNNTSYHEKNANIYSNIAAVDIATARYDSAEYFVRKAIDFSRKDENLFFLCNSLNILADIYIAKKTPAFAEAPLTEAIKIRQQIGDPFYIVSDLSQLAIFYAEQSQPKKGIAASLQGIEIANKFKLLSKLPYLQFALAQNFKAAGKYLKYGETLEKVLSLKDSVYQLNSEQALAEIKAKYNQQKQENIIIQQKLDINRKNSVLFGALIMAFFAVVIAFQIFNNYKRKQKLVVEKIKQEEKRKAQEAILIAEENERKRISADLHDNLGAYASAISSNVDDLVTSDGHIDPSVVDSIKSNAEDIMMNLRETIWVLNKTEIHVTSVSDRFKNYVSRLRDAYPALSINIKENIIKNTALSPASALNMLRIMQEAFHNALKHSKGNSITIEINSDTKLEVSITDNGEGIVNNKKADGNGIDNMQKRAKANGWNLKIKRLQPKGTAVELFT